MKELIRKILNEETNQGKYISALEDLTEDFKNEDCVCDIKIEYKPEEEIYLINVILGNLDIDDKFNGVNWRERDYRGKLKTKIRKEVFDYLPIPFFVEFKQTPKCKDYKNLKESEDKKTKSTNKEFSKYKDSKFNSLRDYTLQDIVDNWDSLSDHKNENIKTIKHFINNPDKIVDLVYDEKGLEDGYHRLLAAKILKKPRFSYRLVENLKESEDKKSRLLSTIEQDGLYQVMKDTSLSLKQIKSKTGELSREVLERYIKDFVENEAESITGSDGDIGFVFPIPLPNSREVESFYLSKGKLTLEINEYDSNGRIVMGSHERLVNLSDSEINRIVKELIDWGEDTYYEL